MAVDSDHSKEPPNSHGPSMIRGFLMLVLAFSCLGVGILGIVLALLVCGLYFMLRKELICAFGIGATPRQHCSFPRLVLIWISTILYISSWFAPVINGIGDNGGSCPLHQALRESSFSGSNPSALLVCCMLAIPACTVLMAIFLWFPKQDTALIDAAYKTFLLIGIFGSLMPFWLWGPAGAMQNLSVFLALFAASRIRPSQKIEPTRYDPQPFQCVSCDALVPPHVATCPHCGWTYLPS